MHSNSGVGNKTAYLISQGGTFNGQTITGIDGGDADADQDGRAVLRRHRPAHLRQRLRQPGRRPRADLPGLRGNGGLHGFTAADCTNVAQGGARDPAAHHADATRRSRRTPPTDLPDRQSYRLLFDSETGAPATAFAAGPDVGPRLTNPLWGSNATSGTTPGTPTTRSTTSASPLDAGDRRSRLPAGQPTLPVVPALAAARLRRAATYYDGGTVEVDNAADAARPSTPRRCPGSTGRRRHLARRPTPGRQGLRRATASAGWPAGSTCPAFAGAPVTPAVHDAQPTQSSATSAGGSTTSRSTPATAARSRPRSATPDAHRPDADARRRPTPTQTADLPEAVRRQRAQGPGWAGQGRRVVAAADHQPGQVTGYQVTTGDTTIGDRAAARKAVFKGLQNGQDVHLHGGRLGVGGYVTPGGDRDGQRAPRSRSRSPRPAGKTRLTGKL